MWKFGRSKRTQNRTDTKPCLSDVYKERTRAKRRQADVRLSGRSMVEMLGVLAIIGVLSVGAISGYSKAMEKYRWNKFVNSVNLLVAQATQFIANNKASDTESLNLTAMLHKINAFPKGFYLSGTTFRYTPNIGFQYGYIYQYSSEHNVLEIYFESPTSDFCKKTLTTPWEGLAWDYQGGGLRVYSSEQKQYIKFTKPLNINDANRACDPWTVARSRISFYYRY